MTDQELEAAGARLRVLCASIAGFHALAGDDEHPPAPLDRLRYEANVYASGVELAALITRLMTAAGDQAG